MPLRDHFRPPVSKKSSWEGFHAMWPTCIVQQLRKQLPPGFIAEPRPPGNPHGDRRGPGSATPEQGSANGNVARRAWTAPSASRRDRRVRVRGPHLRCRARTATGGRDRIRQPGEQGSSRVAGLLRGQVRRAAPQGRRCQRRRSRYDSSVQPVRPVDGLRRPSGSVHDRRGPPTYAASCRWLTKGTRARLEAWSHTMAIGQPLPTLPLWLADSLVIPLDLEQSYEQACHDLWIA